MSLIWSFKKKQPDDTTRDPISGEFFATEAIRNSAEALVREGVQNTMDARVDGQVAKVRILISGPEWAATPSRAAAFLGKLKPHIEAPGNGIRPNRQPDLTKPCQFLTFEDFGTTGLEGDPLQWHRIEGRLNGFFAFFRAEGENAKSDGGRRGRWGIGKFVFPRASKGSAFIGWTVRKSDQRSLLLGRCILKSHRTKEGYHVPDGYLGSRVILDEGTITGPADDRDLIALFRDTFRLLRRDEPGLSLVVPWYDDDISKETLLDAAIRDWFYCLMAGELEIDIVDPSGTVTLNQSTIDAQIERLGPDDRRELEPLMKLTRFALSAAGKSPLLCQSPDQANSAKWHDSMLDDGVKEKARAFLDSGDPVALRVPIVVRPKRGGASDSHFDVFLVRDSAYDGGRPVFVREGIIVSDAKGRPARGFRSLVVCTDKPLADLLGDAENPAHTEWRADTGNFRDKYVYGNGYINFVRESARNLVSSIEQDAEDTSPDLLADFFSLPEEPDPARPVRPAPTANRKGDKEPPPTVFPVPTPRRYSVTKVRGGFTITPGASGAQTPAQLLITVAYDVRRGDPFKRYDPADFLLMRDGIGDASDVQGLKPMTISENKVRYEVTEPDFRVSITGFDMNRDLVLKIATSGELDASKT